MVPPRPHGNGLCVTFGDLGHEGTAAWAENVPEVICNGQTLLPESACEYGGHALRVSHLKSQDL